MKYTLTLIIFTLFLSSCEKVELPLAPSKLSAEVISDKEIKLIWEDNSTNEEGFKIEVKAENEPYKVLGQASANTTTYKLENLTPNTNYEIRVFSFNNGGNSATYSNVVKTKTLLLTPPTLETSSEVVIGRTDAYVYARIINVGGGIYPNDLGFFYSSTNPNPKETDSKKVNDACPACYDGNFRAFLTQLLPNTTYYFRGYAKNNIGIGYGNVFTFKTQP